MVAAKISVNIFILTLLNLSLLFQTAVFMLQALHLLLYFQDLLLQLGVLLLYKSAFLLHRGTITTFFYLNIFKLGDMSVCTFIYMDLLFLNCLSTILVFVFRNRFLFISTSFKFLGIVFVVIYAISQYFLFLQYCFILCLWTDEMT